MNKSMMYSHYTVDPKKNIRVIYIAGPEHSGSTFLGTVLGNHSEIVCVGEISQLPRLGWKDNSYLCACGDILSECPFWSAILQAWGASIDSPVESYLKLESAFDRNLQLPRVMIEKYFRSALFEKYCRYTATLFRSIYEVSGAQIVVDTSKRAGRALALSMVDGIDLRLIHLVRDVRGVVYSSAKPTRAIRRSYFHSIIRWGLINYGIEQIQLFLDKDKTLFLRYEDLIRSPMDALLGIGKFVGVDLTVEAETLVNGASFSVNHLGIGNALRLGKSVQLRPDIYWSNQMPRKVQQLIGIFVWRLMKRYGYKV